MSDTPETKKYVVVFVETDGNSLDGVHGKVMEGTDPESVARERVADACEWYKSECAKGNDGIPWEEETIMSQLEDEDQIKRIISARHGYYQVHVFTLDGECLEIDLIDQK